MDMNIFAKRLKNLMELEGISQRSLSMKINVDRKSIRYWLSGEYFPQYHALIKLSVYFRVRMDYLAGLEDSMESGSNFALDDISAAAVSLRFHQRLNAYMDTSGMTKYALAKQLNIDQKALTKWFTQGSMPEVSTLVKLAQLMKVSMQELLLGE